jgi:hypothetical protein
MKKTIVTLLVVAAFFAGSDKVNAGWFGASFGTEPSVTLFGQTLTVPVPSVILGAEAGMSVGGKVSPSGVRISLPFVKVGVRSPKLTVGVKGAKINVTASGVHKASDSKKRASSKKSKK